MFRKKIQISIILVISVLNFTGCKKESTLELNKEEMFSLGSTGLGSSSVPYIEACYMPYFDISNYSNLKSVVLAVTDIKTFNDQGEDITGVGNWELYDITNGKVIENSTVSSDDIPENTYKTSANFINNFPKGKIKLGIRTVCGGTYNANCRNVYLILSR